MLNKSPSVFLENAWYVACLSTDLNSTDMLARLLLNRHVLMYRTEAGAPVAMQDRCPHRFVPLHLGKREGDEVVCPYHGLKFNGQGTCTYNPHGNNAIPKAAQVKTYPLLERFGFIWIWVGEAAADESKLPDYSPLDIGHENAVAYTYMHTDANYELLVDNVMDLSHIDHLHGEIITTRGKLSPLTPALREGDDTLSARWEWAQQPAMLIFNQFLPEPAAEARMFFDITWAPPANIQLSVGATQNNGALDLENCVGQYDLHTVTPETETSTHYWFATRRNHIVEDGDFNAFKIKAMHDAFSSEDLPLLEAVETEMGGEDFFSLHPVLLSNDVAPVKVRRLLRQLIEQQG
jgi:vanillate O-demethylase monooxygenase subunit